MLGVPYFIGPEQRSKCAQMEKEFRKAQKTDRSSRPEEATLLRAFKQSKGESGEDEGGEDDVKSSESEKAIIKWVKMIRDKWQGHVIRQIGRAHV